MSKEVLHVVPHNEGWAVKREGNERSSSTHATQKDAIDSARDLAREGDDIVVHRPDGTIRERTTYSSSGNGNGVAAKTGTLRPNDVLSVGSRVSWAAVLAGAVVALTVYITLTVLAAAIGFSVSRYVSSSEFTIGAAVVATFSLLVSLFLGGYVASQTTAGEDRKEAAIYGVLVWGALFGMLFLAGNTLAVGFGTVLQPLSQSPEVAGGGNATAVAWWAFATIVLSLAAAVGGSLLGAGPELIFFRRTETPRAAAPQKV